MNQVPGSSAAPSWRLFALAYAVLFLVTQLPLYLVSYPDIFELADHIARIHVLQQSTQSGPSSAASAAQLLQQYYAVDRSQLLPNLAMDALLPPLAGLLGAALAVKLFASLATLALTTGAIALGRALTGRLSLLQLGALMFANNSALMSGYLNYIAGLGAAFWLLAAWIRSTGRLRWPALLGFAAGATALYLCHLSAFGIYVLGAIGWQLRGAIATGGAVPALVQGPAGRAMAPALFAVGQFIPAELIYVTRAGPVAAASWVDPSLSAGWWSVLEHKLVLLVSVPLAGVPADPQWIYLLPLLICLALALAVLRGAVMFQTATGWMAIPVALAILFLPYSGFGTSSVDARLLPALLLIVWAGLDLVAPAAALRIGVICLVGAATVASSAVVLVQWRQHDAEYAALRTALAALPAGARVATVADTAGGAKPSLSPHFAAWGIIDRELLLSSFDIMPFHPYWVGFRPQYVGLARLARNDDPRLPVPDVALLQSRFDYLIVFGGDATDPRDYGTALPAVYETPHVRIVATAAAPAP
jgi:hypothetical protein